MRSITVREGQTLFDIAMQYLGDTERTNEVMDLNGLDFTTALTAGRILLIPDTEISVQYIADEFLEKGLFPASDNGELIEDEGVDFWAIEDDFVVS